MSTNPAESTGVLRAPLALELTPHARCGVDSAQRLFEDVGYADEAPSIVALLDSGRYLEAGQQLHALIEHIRKVDALIFNLETMKQAWRNRDVWRRRFSGSD